MAALKNTYQTSYICFFKWSFGPGRKGLILSMHLLLAVYLLSLSSYCYYMCSTSCPYSHIAIHSFTKIDLFDFIFF